MRSPGEVAVSARDIERFYSLESKRDKDELSMSEEIEYRTLQDNLKDILAWILIEA